MTLLNTNLRVLRFKGADKKYTILKSFAEFKLILTFLLVY